MANESYKTRGIVLHTMPHGESGHIVFMYTEAFGRLSYYITGGRRGVPTISSSRIMLHPLTVIDFVGYKSSGSFHKIKEAKRSFVASSLLSDVYKSTISIYLSELLYKVVKDGENNAFLFDYLYKSIEMLDNMEQGKANFHLFFTLELTKYLGIYPSPDYEQDFFFDMTTGHFVMIRPNNIFHLERSDSFLLWQLMQITPSTLDNFKTKGNIRAFILSKIIEYIGIHHGTQYKLKSLEYMSEIF